jgi:hypothetical protein
VFLIEQDEIVDIVIPGNGSHPFHCKISIACLERKNFSSSVQCTVITSTSFVRLLRQLLTLSILLDVTSYPVSLTKFSNALTHIECIVSVIGTDESMTTFRFKADNPGAWFLHWLVVLSMLSIFKYLLDSLATSTGT